jgi:restriction system protein
MVRAGRGGELFQDFRDEKTVGLGWNETGNLQALSREQVVEKVVESYPAYKRQKAIMSAGQLFRFASEMKVNDHVITYDSSRRVYLLGRIASSYEYRINAVAHHCHARKVEWEGEVDRDKLSVPTRNSLGSISSLFLISPQAAEEVLTIAKGEVFVPHPSEDVEVEETEQDLLKEIQSRSREFIKDRLDKLDWDEMQEVVAGLLRAMGYKTKVSPAGADRGKDIVASPDGLGFESPRIVVEVKHRVAAMGADAIRSFLGGRHKDDKGLYVSTGGFTKDARYEAERAAIPVNLMDLDGLVDSILEHYEGMDSGVRALLPLVRVYWPG